jgi:hypothetical protein
MSLLLSQNPYLFISYPFIVGINDYLSFILLYYKMFIAMDKKKGDIFSFLPNLCVIVTYC